MPANATPNKPENLNYTWSYDDTPASNDKCKFECNSWFYWDWSQCTYICTWSSPTDSSICPWDSTWLTANTPKTLVASCSSPAWSDPKCEYKCDSPKVYSWATNSCK